MTDLVFGVCSELPGPESSAVDLKTRYTEVIEILYILSTGLMGADQTNMVRHIPTLGSVIYTLKIKFERNEEVRNECMERKQ